MTLQECKEIGEVISKLSMTPKTLVKWLNDWLWLAGPSSSQPSRVDDETINACCGYLSREMKEHLEKYHQSTQVGKLKET